MSVVLVVVGGQMSVGCWWADVGCLFVVVGGQMSVGCWWLLVVRCRLVLGGHMSVVCWRSAVGCRKSQRHLSTSALNGCE
jgi:hypothetical protein